MFQGTANTAYQPVPPTNTAYQPVPPANTSYQPVPPANTAYQPGPPASTAYQPVPQATSPYQPVPAAPIPSQPKPGQFGATPYPVPREFTPVNNAVVQGPGSVQPPSPSHAAPMQPAVTASPPPTIQTVDTSNVPGICLSIYLFFLVGKFIMFSIIWILYPWIILILLYLLFSDKL